MLEDGAIVFRGIPYARPPVDNRRWRKPEPFTLNTCWNGTLKAHNSSETCWQVYSNGTINGREDCLTLDIVTPQVRYINPLPVSDKVYKELCGVKYKTKTQELEEILRLRREK